MIKRLGSIALVTAFFLVVGCKGSKVVTEPDKSTLKVEVDQAQSVSSGSGGRSGTTTGSIAGEAAKPK